MAALVLWVGVTVRESFIEDFGVYSLWYIHMGALTIYIFIYFLIRSRLLFIVQRPVAGLEPHKQMLIGRHDLSLRIRILIRRALIRHKVPHPIARHRPQLRRAHGMTEKGNRIPRPGAGLARDPARLVAGREDDPVNGAPKEAVGPVREQVANVDQDGRAGVVLRAGRTDGYGGPGAVLLLELQSGLASEPEEQRDGAVVGVRAGTDVVAGAGGLVGGWVAEEAQDGGGFAVGAVCRGEEVVDLVDVSIRRCMRSMDREVRI